MATFLFAWNPKKWDWKEQELANRIQLVASQGYAADNWSSGKRKNLPVGSRFFLIRLGQKPTGIVASGMTTSEPGHKPHWDQNLRRHGKENLSVGIHFDFLAKTPLVEWDELQVPPFSSASWGIQAGGVALPASVADALEELWQRRTRGDDPVIPEELDPALTFEEGTAKQVLVNAYERDPQARAACIAHFGLRCLVCDLLMEDRYGSIAEGFIHVHHITPLAKVGRTYRVGPRKDLLPLCPNCHAIVHRRNPPLSIEEAKALLRKQDRKTGTPMALELTRT